MRISKGCKLAVVGMLISFSTITAQTESTSQASGSITQGNATFQVKDEFAHWDSREKTLSIWLFSKELTESEIKKLKKNPRHKNSPYARVEFEFKDDKPDKCWLYLGGLDNTKRQWSIPVSIKKVKVKELQGKKNGIVHFEMKQDEHTFVGQTFEWDVKIETQVGKSK